MVYRDLDIDGSDTGEECRLKCELENTSGYASNQYRYVTRVLHSYLCDKGYIYCPHRPKCLQISISPMRRGRGKDRCSHREESRRGEAEHKHVVIDKHGIDNGPHIL